MSQRIDSGVTLDISYDDTRELSRKLDDLKSRIKALHAHYTESAGIEFDWDMEALDYSALLAEAANTLARAADSWIKRRNAVAHGHRYDVHAAAR